MAVSSSGWEVIRRQPVGAVFGGITVSAVLAVAVTGAAHAYQRAPSQVHRASWAGTVTHTVNQHGPSGTVQPRATVPVPRRTAARATWTSALGTANAHGPSGIAQPRATVPVPRRAAARAVTRAGAAPPIIALPVTGGRVVQHTVTPHRATWASAAGPANQHGPAGSVQPRATVPVPRRAAARAAWERALGPANAHGPSGSVQPATVTGRRPAPRAQWRQATGQPPPAPAATAAVQQRPPQVPRRAPARAVTRWLAGPGNARGPNGGLQPRATVPPPRRTSARASWQHIVGHAAATAPTPAGTVQPRATIQALRRTPPRAVTRGTAASPGANAHGPSGTVQPRATAPQPRRAPARGAWPQPRPPHAAGPAPAVILVTLGRPRLPWALGRSRLPWSLGAARND